MQPESWWYFHLMMAACSLYMAMLLTGWSSEPAHIGPGHVPTAAAHGAIPANVASSYSVGLPSFWVKVTHTPTDADPVVHAPETPPHHRLSPPAALSTLPHAAPPHPPTPPTLFRATSTLQPPAHPRFPHLHLHSPRPPARPQVLSQWVCLVLYAWTLLAPYLLREYRDFGIEFDF